MTEQTLDADFWDARYRSGDTGWDLGEPSPPFVALHETGEIAPCRVAVPGCGAGWEVAWLAVRGYAVTGIDFSPTALARTRERLTAAGADAELVREDVLAPSAALAGRFDLILEQTCYCAIDPADRARYVAAMHKLLAPGGRLIGLFYQCGPGDGPPFSTTPEEVKTLFSGCFDITRLAVTPHSHERRGGEEWLGILTRTG